MKAIERPDFKPLGRYSTKDVIDKFGFHVNTLNNYVKRGYITPLPRKVNRKENRYLGRDLLKLYDLIS